MHPADAALAPFRAAPGQAAVLLDFDGTLAPIVEDPASAVPLPAVAATLEGLRQRYAVVAVVSGRPVAFLVRHLPPGLTLCGLYGLEQRRGGVLSEHPQAAGWRSTIDAVAADAARSLPTDVEVEHKGLSLTLHFRRHPEHATTTGVWAAEAANVAGLHVRPAKMSLELHPPVTVDKGTVVDELTEGLSLACYVGDDAGDLPAFDALDRLAARGGTVLRVAVETTESSAPVLARADVRVSGPEGALDLLQALL